jgi:hypothetical protein
MVERNYTTLDLKEFDALTHYQFELWLYYQNKADWELTI